MEQQSSKRKNVMKRWSGCDSDVDGNTFAFHLRTDGLKRLEEKCVIFVIW